MADILMRPGWANLVQLKTGSTTLNIPVLRGSYARQDGRIVEMLAQGNAQNAYPINSTKAPDSSVLNISARAFTTWFTAANLNALFVTRDTNGDLAGLDMKVANGIDTTTDVGKASALRIACSAGQGQLTVDLSVLGKAVSSAATFSAFSAVSGSPFYQRGVSFTWTPQGGSALTLSEVEDFVFTLATGVTPGKWFDSTDGLSSLDQGIQSGAAVITQRVGATNRMDASTAGTLDILMVDAGQSVGVQASLQLVRLESGKLIDPGAPGGAKVASTWALLSLAGANPVSFTAPTIP